MDQGGNGSVLACLTIPVAADGCEACPAGPARKPDDTNPRFGKPLAVAVAEKPQPAGQQPPVNRARADSRSVRVSSSIISGSSSSSAAARPRPSIARSTNATNDVVALKLLSLADDWPDDLLDEAKLRLLREADAAGSLAHPDIVEIREAGEHEGQVYMAMEYVEGVNLATHATEGRMLPPRLVCEMCARVADAVYFAHQRGIIHRDIKPANIVFDQKNRRVRVMDFGVARLENSRATRTGVILGSPSYMAPEQLDARPVTPQSDLFSLGVTLFQLLTGMLPFRSDSIPGPDAEDLRANRIRRCASSGPTCRRARGDSSTARSKRTRRLRYRSGAEMAQALRDCARDIDPALR